MLLRVGERRFLKMLAALSSIRCPCLVSLTVSGRAGGPAIAFSAGRFTPVATRSTKHIPPSSPQATRHLARFPSHHVFLSAVGGCPKRARPCRPGPVGSRQEKRKEGTETIYLIVLTPFAARRLAAIPRAMRSSFSLLAVVPSEARPCRPGPAGGSRVFPSLVRRRGAHPYRNSFVDPKARAGISGHTGVCLGSEGRIFLRPLRCLAWATHGRIVRSFSGYHGGNHEHGSESALSIGRTGPSG